MKKTRVQHEIACGAMSKLSEISWNFVQSVISVASPDTLLSRLSNRQTLEE
jgi:hypothetical protein